MFHHSKAWFIQIGVPKPGVNLKRRLPESGLKKTPLLLLGRIILLTYIPIGFWRFTQPGGPGEDL